MRQAKLLSLFAAIALAFPLAAHAQREKLSDEDVDFVHRRWPHAHKLFTCIRYVVERSGNGDVAPPKPGDLVSVLYQGSLLSEYQKHPDHPQIFDKVLDPKHPFEVRVGRGQVIEGWDEMLQLMEPGAKYLVVIPSELAYGARGQPPSIPRDAALVFEMEILKVDREK